MNPPQQVGSAMRPGGKFVHLHCHSEYSLLDGANRIPLLVGRAAELGMEALAITDHGVMHGAAEFYRECKSAGIKPVIGVEAYMAPRRRTDREPRVDSSAWHMLLLARNNEGYRNLLKLTTIAAVEGFYHKPRIDRQTLEQHAGGLIATSACLGSEICSALLDDDYRRARDAAAYYRDLFGDGNYYIELQDHHLDEQAKVNPQLLQIATELGLPVICSNDVHYLGREDADAHDILLCIQTRSLVSDEKRMRFATQEFYLKGQREMYDLFEHQEAGLEQTAEVADRCDVSLEFGRCPLPSPGLPEGVGAHEYLTQLAHSGLEAKYGGSPTEEVRRRLQFELDVIEKTGFSQYMLIVRDFARFASDHSIFYGVRGSAAGSLTSYLVDITDIDPMEYGLTFERFLNPERVQMPDVDMDFEDERRGEVLKYVTKKYSPDHEDPCEARVAQIVTFGTLAARAALKDAGRALGYPAAETDRLCKMIPTIPVGTTIGKALEQSSEFRAICADEPQSRALVETAQRLEGVARHTSVHAAGVIIAHEPLVNYTPLSRSADGSLVTQYPAAMLEKIGLLKMDFLGLINLSILATAVKTIKATRGIDIDVRRLPEDDPTTFALLGDGRCVGLFQLEGEQMRRYIQELKPTSIRDLAAMVALYRPGPMQQIPRFIRCKRGLEKITYPHESLSEVLAETYGVIVYQDQVLQIARIIAGYTLGQADVLRKAMGKKQRDEMVKERTNFCDGAEANGVPRTKAEEIFDLLEPFAGYAFNKAHSVCYALVAYQTAYLKANYPVEYMASLLACYRDKPDRLPACMEECARMGIRVLPPDINASSADFTVERWEHDGTASDAIRFGLASVKNVGRGAVEVILRCRELGGAYQSLSDLCVRLQRESTRAGGAAGVPRTVLETLILVGALSALPGHANRRAVLETLDAALGAASALVAEERSGQESMLDMFGGQAEYRHTASVVIPAMPEFARDKVLALERDLLGLYMTEHPLAAVAAQVERAGVTAARNLDAAEERSEVRVAGIVTRLRLLTTRRTGEQMGYFYLEDMTGAVSCAAMPAAWAEYRHILVQDAIVLVEGRISYRDSVRSDEDETHSVEIIVGRIAELHTGAHPSGRDAALHLRIAEDHRPVLKSLKSVVAGQPDDGGDAHCLYIHVPAQDGEAVVQTEMRIQYTDDLRAELERILGRHAVWLE